MKWIPLTAFAATLACGTVAHAEVTHPRKMQCPVGGEVFTHVSTDFYSIWGSRPDGKPYGNWTASVALPVCPGNGLVVYREFKPDEVARLASLIESAEYRAMATRETSYFRAAWLEYTLVPDSGRTVWLLLRASWQADEQPELKAAYQRAFIEQAGHTVAFVDYVDAVILRVRTINAMRELGDFDGALAAVREMSLPFVFRPIAGAMPDGDFKGVRDAETLLWLKELTGALEQAILRRDASSEPLDLISATEAAKRCVRAKEAAADLAPPGICTSGRIAAEIARMRPGDEREE